MSRKEKKKRTPDYKECILKSVHVVFILKLWFIMRSGEKLISVKDFFNQLYEVY